VRGGGGRRKEEGGKEGMREVYRDSGIVEGMQRSENRGQQCEGANDGA
jgi:hypothetical protein